MRAIRVHEFGGPEVLVCEEIPDPVAGPGQVVVGLEAADVIYLDTLLRQGWGQEIFPREPPYVPGGGGAGEVLSVGGGVDPGWVGRRVVARTSSGYAERIVASVEDIVEVPDGLGAREAAAVLHDGVTALMLTGRAPVRASERVLVTAATGGAGSLVVQLAHNAGAQVVAAARGRRKLALARQLGADLAIDYSQDGWQDWVRDAVGGVDLAFDGAGGALGVAAFEAVADGGRFVTYGTSNGGFADIDPQAAARRRVCVINALESGPPANDVVRDLLEKALALTAERRIRPHIGATYPLGRARDAHAALANRAVLGKSLLIV
ncbi:zinc-binding dehydrogenase [Amycolatopsis sp. K13G38]|uniref:Zinc-binding dehydrogenase n=1 Tax=Amycolatopsis acididurans TaxID=2724524 RepID=A0ABX1JDG9_9PSEU|nr:zinc-binding dehydrogenase [Amycolatopsis acididurans]